MGWSANTVITVRNKTLFLASKRPTEGEASKAQAYHGGERQEGRMRLKEGIEKKKEIIQETVVIIPPDGSTQAENCVVCTSKTFRAILDKINVTGRVTLTLRAHRRRPTKPTPADKEHVIPNCSGDSCYPHSSVVSRQPHWTGLLSSKLLNYIFLLYKWWGLYRPWRYFCFRNILFCLSTENLPVWCTKIILVESERHEKDKWT